MGICSDYNGLSRLVFIGALAICMAFVQSGNITFFPSNQWWTSSYERFNGFWFVLMATGEKCSCLSWCVRCWISLWICGHVEECLEKPCLEIPNCAHVSFSPCWPLWFCKALSVTWIAFVEHESRTFKVEKQKLFNEHLQSDFCCNIYIY